MEKKPENKKKQPKTEIMENFRLWKESRNLMAFSRETEGDAAEHRTFGRGETLCSRAENIFCQAADVFEEKNMADYWKPSSANRMLENLGGYKTKLYMLYDSGKIKKEVLSRGLILTSRIRRELLKEIKILEAEKEKQKKGKNTETTPEEELLDNVFGKRRRPENEKDEKKRNNRKKEEE